MPSSFSWKLWAQRSPKGFTKAWSERCIIQGSEHQTLPEAMKETKDVGECRHFKTLAIRRRSLSSNRKTKRVLQNASAYVISNVGRVKKETSPTDTKFNDRPMILVISWMDSSWRLPRKEEEWNCPWIWAPRPWRGGRNLRWHIRCRVHRCIFFEAKEKMAHFYHADDAEKNHKIVAAKCFLTSALLHRRMWWEFKFYWSDDPSWKNASSGDITLRDRSFGREKSQETWFETSVAVFFSKR